MTLNVTHNRVKRSEIWVLELPSPLLNMLVETLVNANGCPPEAVVGDSNSHVSADVDTRETLTSSATRIAVVGCLLDPPLATLCTKRPEDPDVRQRHSNRRVRRRRTPLLGR